MNDAARSQPLSPPVEPYKVGQLQVSPIHSIYFECCGNPKGLPALVLHGGPGFGCTPTMRRYFDPSQYNIILFDQRGCGRSIPHASLIDNHTAALIDDIEKLRCHLGFEAWLVFGGSWGSTLALAYAEHLPRRARALILRGIFLLRKVELDWFYRDEWGAAALFPDYWEDFLRPIPEHERSDMIAAYYTRLTSGDPASMLEAARAWTRWEAATSYSKLNEEFISTMDEPDRAIAFARLEAHYFVNGGFFDRDGQLLENAGQVREIPGAIIQGRYDVICPMRSAWELHRAWPNASFHCIADAGHASSESGISDALIATTNHFAAGC